MMKAILIKKIFLSCALLLFLFILNTGLIQAQDASQEVVISVFVRDECGHCQDEKVFLSDFERELSLHVVGPRLKLNYYNLKDPVNVELFSQVAETYGLVKGTPITLIKGRIFTGFGSSRNTGELIRQLTYGQAHENWIFEDILDGRAVVVDALHPGEVCDEDELCQVPAPESSRPTVSLFGWEIDTSGLSLGALAAVLGFVDGFNPCAMWVLVMFLIILSQLGSRKKMLQYAGVFILAEAIMYYLILNVWFTVWDFVSLDRIVTPLVGLLALGSGVYFIYKFITFTPECKVTNLEQKSRTTAKVKELAAKPFTIAVFFGILGLALSVNIFEFACSIGIPQTFTKVIEMNNLNWLQTQGYMLIYIVMYMVDDLIVFGLALWGLDKLGLTHKYSKWATLIGAVLMLLLGFIMLIRPSLLVF